ncbi:potassium transporter 26-like [Dorcoceras hygrometricum]|uniref:Potassium transporter 26-like n=1 Tax=Dorcoceras hygrometricum TaxID=472368 RepID=A0A2Z7A5A9_9LAMI|nr:potassium transporter 26-like [Dorcoceras hygrometricum]
MGSHNEIEMEFSDGNTQNKNGGVNQNLSLESLYKKYFPRTSQPKEYDAGRTLLLAYQTLGIVYGDIGTSPLYVLPSSVLENPTREDFLGIFSIIFWTLTIIPLIKYVFIVLRADDNGEGGTFALYSYLCRHINFRNNLTIQDTRLPSDSNLMYYQQGSTIKNKSKAFIEKSNTAQFLLTFFVLLGTCMVIGDGALTPATSVMVTSPRSNLNVIFSFAAVLSALSGIQTLSPKITTNYVVLMAVILLLILFYFQRFGTSKVSCSFSPIMFLWFATNAAIGLYNIVNYHPSILKGISPYYMFKFFQRRKRTGWELLGAAFLCTSGAEAMFADLGHFNKRSIQIAFSAFVYPSLVLCYAGEAAYLIQNPEKLSTAYYSSIPTPVYWPMFVIATLSAVVASQSMISATFSIVKQSLALGCFPRVNMLHTSSKHEGQVYSPEVNFILGILCIALVVGFKQGVEIGNAYGKKFKQGVEISNAYGVAIICVMLITTSLVTVVMLVIWDTNFLLILAFFVPFLFIEGCFLSAMVNKIPLGGWVPFAIASFFMIIMLSWTSGRSKKTKYDSERKLGFEELHRILYESNLHHPSGICLFCADLVNGIPPIIRHYIHNTNSLREITIIVTIRTLPIKTVLPEERFDVAKVGFDGVYRCLIQFGYKDEQSLEGNAVRLIVEKLKEISESTEEAMKLDSALDKGVVFVTGRTILKSKENNGRLTRWTINYLYRFLQKNSVSSVSSLKIPPENFLQVEKKVVEAKRKVVKNSRASELKKNGFFATSFLMSLLMTTTRGIILLFFRSTLACLNFSPVDFVSQLDSAVRHLAKEFGRSIDFGWFGLQLRRSIDGGGGGEESESKIVVRKWEGLRLLVRSSGDKIINCN